MQAIEGQQKSCTRETVHHNRLQKKPACGDWRPPNVQACPQLFMAHSGLDAQLGCTPPQLDCGHHAQLNGATGGGHTVSIGEVVVGASRVHLHPKLAGVLGAEEEVKGGAQPRHDDDGREEQRGRGTHQWSCSPVSITRCREEVLQKASTFYSSALLWFIMVSSGCYVFFSYFVCHQPIYTKGWGRNICRKVWEKVGRYAERSGQG